MRLLLVEDDDMIGQEIMIALKDAAYAVDWVRDGESADRALAFGKHQAVLLDLGLPGKMDGLAVLRRMRQSNNLTPVLILTGMEGIARARRLTEQLLDLANVQAESSAEVMLDLSVVLRDRVAESLPVAISLDID